MTELLEIPFRFENEQIILSLSPYRKRIDYCYVDPFRRFTIVDTAEKVVVGIVDKSFLGCGESRREILVWKVNNRYETFT